MNKWIAIFAALLMSATVQAATPKPPDQVVQDTTAQLQQLLHDNRDKYKADSKLYYKVVNDVVVPHFDVRYIGQLVLARNWRSATEDQRTRFQNAFRDMLIRSYANTMLEYSDSVKADWKPLRMAADATDVTVNSDLLREGKQPVAVGFAMHLVNGDWKIYDIVVENISLVTNFRSQFNAEIKKNGLDSVITRMETGQYAPDPKSNQAGDGSKS